MGVGGLKPPGATLNSPILFIVDQRADSIVDIIFIPPSYWMELCNRMTYVLITSMRRLLKKTPPVHVNLDRRHQLALAARSFRAAIKEMCIKNP